MIATDKDVREWAVEVGLEVCECGKVTRHMWDVYLEQHPEANN